MTAALLAGVLASVLSLSDFLAQQDVRRAKIQAAVLCRKLGCPAAFDIVVEPTMPGDGIIAYTTRTGYGAGFEGERCVLHFTKASVQSIGVVAHEVCHCAADWEVLGPAGWQHQVGRAEMREREREALACEAREGRGGREGR